mgnify:CR=1 FL=1
MGLGMEGVGWGEPTGVPGGPLGPPGHPGPPQKPLGALGEGGCKYWDQLAMKTINPS